MWDRVAQQVTSAIFRIEKESPGFVGSLWQITAVTHAEATPMTNETPLDEGQPEGTGPTVAVIEPIRTIACPRWAQTILVRAAAARNTRNAAGPTSRPSRNREGTPACLGCLTWPTWPSWRPFLRLSSGEWPSAASTARDGLKNCWAASRVGLVRPPVSGSMPSASAKSCSWSPCSPSCAAGFPRWSLPSPPPLRPASRSPRRNSPATLSAFSRSIFPGRSAKRSGDFGRRPSCSSSWSCGQTSCSPRTAPVFRWP